ncbi:MAG: FAD-dependent oxidoreductase [Nitrososphaerota archaeon]|nr:FAD-dependent oxidoreductase [Candidatus Bathyarchaeota archaeon]MDW8023697.1 FAD-dependent oxidoreductase [Nitrososphaerota archaeon]
MEIVKNRSEVVESGSRHVKVVGDVDAVVVGGGPSGVAAAISAARNGLEVMLVERYSYLGGMATGGLVLLFIEYDRYEYGILKETVERLAKLSNGVALFPRKKPWILGPETPTWIEGFGLSGGYMPPFDPEMLKFVCNEMAVEAGVRLMLNCTFVDTIKMDDAVQGVIVENKEGRQAVLSKVTIDATGDGDVFAMAGAPFKEDVHPAGLSLSFRMMNVNVEEAMRFIEENPEKYRQLVNRHAQQEGYGLVWFPTTIKGVVLFFQYLRGLSATKVEDLTRAEIEGRRKVMASVEFFRKNVPGFETAILMDTSSQIGTRESRRVEGEYVLTKEDILEGRRFHDAIARNPYFDIPYRCLVPKKIENLLVAGRCISTTHEAQASIRMICPCYATGEAAGAAAATAIEENVPPREISVKKLQERLTRQGVVIKGL